MHSKGVNSLGWHMEKAWRKWSSWTSWL